jgi:predicted ATPase
MLNYIELENFRAFSKRTRIEFRPITVLIGKNSSGKSSVLKFLQMLRQSVNGHEGPFFQLEGRHVNLGAWKDLKNRSARGRYFKYEIGFQSRLSQMSHHIRQTMKSREKGVALGRDIAVAGIPVVDYRIRGERFYFGNGTRGTFDMVAKEAGEKVYGRNFGDLAEIGFLGFPMIVKDPQAAYEAVMNDQFFLAPAREFFSEIKHLGPTRNESPRTIQAESPPDGEVGHKGEHALAHLVRMLDAKRKKKDMPFVLKFCESVLHMDRMELRDQIPGLLASFEARNTDTQVKHWLADFGFGVSQCLPIFVQGALMQNEGLLTIEQPEAQLHPTAQLELGSFFAELWSERGVSSIIETHSGNILLRLRGLVRAGKLKPEDVSVAYFHAENSVTTVSNLKVKPDGELDGNLPMEFFGADIFEALEFNAIPVGGIE